MLPTIHFNLVQILIKTFYLVNSPKLYIFFFPMFDDKNFFHNNFIYDNTTTLTLRKSPTLLTGNSCNIICKKKRRYLILYTYNSSLTKKKRNHNDNYKSRNTLTATKRYSLIIHSHFIERFRVCQYLKLAFSNVRGTTET